MGLFDLFRRQPQPKDIPRTHNERQTLTEEEETIFRQARCPDCGQEKLLEGPSGGLATNYKCGDPLCGSMFNDMLMFGVERLSDAQPAKPPEPQPGATPYRRTV